MKKISAFLITLLISLGMFLPVVFAESVFDSSKTKAAGVMLIDVKSGDALYKLNETDKIYPASTTKIMTSLLAIEKGDMTKTITVGSEIGGFSSASSLLHLKKNEKINFKDLVYGMMMVSGNDAAMTIAKTIGGSVEGFVEMMNEKATELGMEHTHFVNPHGTFNQDHYSTAEDMSKLVIYALKNPEWKKLFTTNEYDLPAHNVGGKPLSTTNKLTDPDPKEGDKKYLYSNATGGKTGLTERPKNNGCLVAIAKKDSSELVALIFGDESADHNGRFTIAKYLFETGFENFTTVDLKDVLGSITVSEKIANASALDEDDGMMEFGPDTSEGIYSTVSSSMVDKIKNNLQGVLPVPDFTREKKAPIKEGDVFGTITYKYDDQIVATANLVATRDMDADGQEASPDASASSSGSPVSTQKPTELFPDSTISLWWLMILPAVLGVVILIRVMTVNKKRKTRFKNKRKVYNYRIK
jgi:D-alanyl-D-alanine carboxypeptidase (penicillin-binding protein 5/6)